eukprot:9110408-Lingulodinium_polyedra.AAC.1
MVACTASGLGRLLSLTPGLRSLGVLHVSILPSPVSSTEFATEITSTTLVKVLILCLLRVTRRKFVASYVTRLSGTLPLCQVNGTCQDRAAGLTYAYRSHFPA